MTTKFSFGSESDQLFKAIASLKSKKEYEKFFRDLCTLAELKAMTERFSVVQKLDEGKPYRQIAKETGTSTGTITRIAHWLENGMGGYKLALNRLHHR